MVDMNKPMDNETEKVLAKCYKAILDAHIVYKNDNSELDVTIGVGISPDETDDDLFYCADTINDLRSLLKGSYNWENNNADFYITSFSNGDVTWEAT